LTRNKKTLIWLIPIFFVLLISIVAFNYISGEKGERGNIEKERITIPKGASAWKVAGILKESGLIKDARRFVYHLKWRKSANKLKSGTYEFTYSSSSKEIADKIINGDELEVSITFPEGWTVYQIASEYMNQGICDSSIFVESISDTELLSKLGLEDIPSLEGLLFPETYTFRMNQKAEKVIETMVNVFLEQTGQDWLTRTRESKGGLKSIITLASIVQGEYQLIEEVGDIAALYSNRLSIGMKLQADPTIQYILPEGPRRLTHRDLRINSPYNTYRFKGLPPGPINNPGLPALIASLNPPDKPWIYMVAKGDGGHTFTTTYEDHLQAKKRLDAIRRQYDREKRNEGK